MTNNFYKQIGWLGMALLLHLSSCSDEGMPPHPGKVEERAALRVSGASTGIDVQTRAGDRETLASGSIGVFLKADATNGYTAIDNRCFTYGTPYWTTGTPLLLGDYPATLAAYYPYSVGKANPLLLRSQRLTGAEDLCCVNFRADLSSSTVTLDLMRVYSCIEFNFSTAAPDLYKGDGKVTGINFSGNGILPVAMFDMFDPGFTDGTKTISEIIDPFTGVYGVNISGFTTRFTPAAPDVADCLIIPYRLSGDIEFVITLDGAVMKGKVTAEQLCGAACTLNEGTKYVINVKVRAKGLEVSSIRKMEWEASNVDGDYVIQ